MSTCNKILQGTGRDLPKTCAVCGLGGSCPMLLPHQERVVAERAGLDTLLNALLKFISDSQTFRELPPAERELLRMQAKAMGDYAHILGRRIENFNPATPMVIFRRLALATLDDPLGGQIEDVAVREDQLSEHAIMPLPRGVQQSIRHVTLGWINENHPGMARL